MIPISIPSVDLLDSKYILKCLKFNSVSTVGDLVNKFEIEIEKIHETGFCALANTGTSALHLSLKALDINKNDLVITQSYSFIATANAIKYLDAIPIFLDINKDTYSLSFQSVSEFVKKHCFVKKRKIYLKISKKHIKAIVPVLSFGRSTNFKDLSLIKKKFDIKIILDAAGSFGNPDLFKSKNIRLLDAIIYSFNGNKIITTGGGGAVICNSKNLIKRIRHLSTTARIKSKYIHDEVAFNYRMPNLNAALGLSQIKKLNLNIIKKSKIHERYFNFLKTFKDWKLVNHDSKNSNYWLSALEYRGANKSQVSSFINYLNKFGIDAKKFWQPIHQMPPYKDIFKLQQEIDLSNTTQISKNLIVLPNYAKLQISNIKFILNKIKRFPLK